MEKDNQKYVYIALIYIPSAVGRFVKFWTWYGYSHVTFSFDENLENCHAFSRIKEHTPFVGGYVNEKKSYYSTLYEDKLKGLINDNDFQECMKRKLMKEILKLKNLWLFFSFKS